MAKARSASAFCRSIAASDTERRQGENVPNNRRLAMLTLFAVAALLPITAASQTKLNLGVGVGSDFITAFVAKDEGFFEKHGLDVALSTVVNSALMPAALVGGTVQIAILTGPNIVLANDGGLDLVAVAGIARIQTTNPRSNLVTRAALKISMPEDLRGKKIGIPGINSSLDLIFKKWLLDRHVPPSEVTEVEAPFAQMTDMLRGGQLDGALPVEPALSRIVDSGAAVKTFAVQSDVNPDFLASFWAATRDWATQNRATILAYRAALADAWEFIKEHPDEVDAIEKRHLGYVDPHGPTIALDLKPIDFQFWIDLCRQVGVLRQPVDATTIVFD
jgi:NitT/TauT family transport system substrate-binding protein